MSLRTYVPAILVLAIVLSARITLPAEPAAPPQVSSPAPARPAPGPEVPAKPAEPSKVAPSTPAKPAPGPQASPEPKETPKVSPPTPAKPAPGPQASPEPAKTPSVAPPAPAAPKRPSDPEAIQQDHPQFFVHVDVDHRTRNYEQGDSLVVRVTSEADAYVHVV